MLRAFREKRSLSPAVVLVPAAIVTVLLFATMTGPIDFALLDTMWNPTSDTVYRVLHNLDENELETYRRMLLIDFAFAVSYAVTLAAAMSALTSAGSRRVLTVLFLLPACTALLDFTENTIILVLIDALPEVMPSARVLGPVTSAKWVFAAASVATVVVLGAGRFVFRKR